MKKERQMGKVIEQQFMIRMWVIKFFLEQITHR